MAGPRQNRTAPTAQPSARARGNVQPAAPAPTERRDKFGNIVPDPATDPEGYSAWHAANMQAQREGAYGLERQQELAQPEVGAAIQADRDRVMGTQPTGGTGQFGQGTTTRPTYQQIFDSIPEGSMGFSGPGIIDPAALRTAGSRFQLTPESQNALQQRTAGLFAGMDLTGGGTVPNPSKAETAADQARGALGPAPRLDQGLADRQLGAYQEALGMSRDVLDRLLNGPSVAEKVGARSLENQLAIARSARGGPGAVQDALNQAQQQAPQLQAQAAQQAISEENARLSTAGNVASNFAQAALGARGQDVQIASANTQAATAMVGEIARLTGTQLTLDQQNEQFLGQMARDWAQLDFDFSKMDMEAQEAYFDRQVQIYGIDKQVAAQMKAIAAQEGIGPADWFNGAVGILGAAAGVGAAAIKGG